MILVVVSKLTTAKTIIYGRNAKIVNLVSEILRDSQDETGTI